MGVSKLVQVQERLVDVLLQGEGSLHGRQTIVPLVTVGLLDVLKNDATATLVLELHQLFGVLALLLGRLAEELMESWEGDVITVEVESLKFKQNIIMIQFEA